MSSQSILESTKESLSIPTEITDFDSVLIEHINSTFAYFNELGLGPVEGYEISGTENTWDEYITSPLFNDVKTLMMLKIRLLFDPPGIAAVITSLNSKIDEYEWRLCAKREVIGWPAPKNS